MYLARTPTFIQSIANRFTWTMPANGAKSVYLTFDDGPVPGATDRAMDMLERYNASATFFCVGDNARKHPSLVKDILESGHRLGNHTQNHLNGWKSRTYSYLKNTLECSRWVESSLFRPPYGKITRKQALSLALRYKLVMWDVLSGDFDRRKSPQECLKNVLDHVKPGSIVVLHDSEKAAKRMLYTLEGTLDMLGEAGYSFQVIE